MDEVKQIGGETRANKRMKGEKIPIQLETRISIYIYRERERKV
tara:strand:- start:8 stop:136 length:129 start_codon:yes stop_codon:yes gene_type:complete